MCGSASRLWHGLLPRAIKKKIQDKKTNEENQTQKNLSFLNKVSKNPMNIEAEKKHIKKQQQKLGWPWMLLLKTRKEFKKLNI